jgi:hypothetical protein
MKLRSVSLFAIALAGIASPARAGDGPGDPPPLPDEQWEEEWYEEGYPEGPDETGVAWEHDGWRDPGLPPDAYAEDVRQAQDQRAAWLEQCRQAYRYDDRGERRGERRGEVIGGVIGGVGGAIIGNRILDSSRLGGTLIGGGVGALAGAAIGGEIGEDADRDRAARRIDQCEDYLIRYERGYAAGPFYGGHGHGHGGYAYGAQGYGAWPPVMWVKVPIVTERRRAACGCREVVEEVIEEVVEEEVVAVPQKRVKIQRVVPAPAKVTKTIRYSK